MYKRPHHQRIATLLKMIDSVFFQRHDCFFGGGTAIVLALGEYRESVDVDFLCATQTGYRGLRAAVFNNGLGDLFITPPKQLRDVRADRYGIRTVLVVDDVPIKFEVIHENRISLVGRLDSALGVPVLSREDLYAEKLLANTDRSGDKATAERDLIDLAMMIEGWGSVPDAAWQKARRAYGESAELAFAQGKQRLEKPGYLAACVEKLQMDDTKQFSQRIAAALKLLSLPKPCLDADGP